MKKVVCINDQTQPLGANVVEHEYINSLDQRVYIIKNAINEGTTKWGMRWVGYNANRFFTQESLEVKEKEYIFALN